MKEITWMNTCSKEKEVKLTTLGKSIPPRTVLNIVLIGCPKAMKELFKTLTPNTYFPQLND
jgi:hypothetical protein